MLVSVSRELTQILMREIPFSRQARRRNCALQRARPALNAAVAFYNVNLIEAEAEVPSLPIFFASEIKQDYPLNLSISLSGGKEIN